MDTLEMPNRIETMDIGMEKKTTKETSNADGNEQGNELDYT